MTSIFIGNLASNKTPDELRKLLQSHGLVDAVESMTDPKLEFLADSFGHRSDSGVKPGHSLVVPKVQGCGGGHTWQPRSMVNVDFPSLH
jgi:hypothetical protein